MADVNWQDAVPDGDSDKYFLEFERNLTPAARRYDAGVGLASLGASLFALVAATRTWTVKRLLVLRTPRWRWPVVIAANAVWIYYNWATAQFLWLQLNREEFPPWADSLAIPLFGISVTAIVGGALMNCGLLLSLYGAQLPAPMWSRPRTSRAWLVNAGVGFALLMCTWAGIDAVILGDAYTPPAVVAVMALLLVGRAAAGTLPNNSPERTRESQSAHP